MVEPDQGSETIQVDNPPDSCKTCFFAHVQPISAGVQAGGLICCRNAPTQGPLGGLGAVWPIVQPDFWCGEFFDMSSGDPGIYVFGAGFSGTITTASLGNTTGTMTFTNGVLTSQKAAT